MDYKVLYRKYRPDSFKNIIGQDFTIKMLQNAINNQKVSHAYIFTGPRGTGKTSTAKVFAKAINCEQPIDGEPCGHCVPCETFTNNSDIIEIDAASNNGVDEIRELINNIKIAPTNSKYKIYIIDEVHMMTQSAFNALLLTLEEPPAHVIFIMATTNIESVPITILSRCQRFDFKKISMDDLKNRIHYVCKEENIDITEDAVEEIAYIAEGGLRDALSLLDQLSASSNQITIENILSNYGSISTVFIKEIIQNLLENNMKEITKSMDELKNSAADYKIFIKKLIQELVNVAIKMKCEHFLVGFSYEEIKNLIFELNDCLNRSNININPYTLVEITLLGVMKENNVKSGKISIKEDGIEKKSKEEVSSEVVQQTPLKEEIEMEEKHSTVDVSSLESNKDQEKNVDYSELKRIRLNNCFVGAKKEALNFLKEKWNEIATDIEIEDDVKSLLIDCSVVASSETVAVITANLPSTAMLINNRITEISAILSEFYDQEMKIIALSEEEWQQEKQQYVKNIKSGITYQLMEEPEEELEEMLESNSNSIEKIAQDLFDSDKIEII